MFCCQIQNPKFQIASYYTKHQLQLLLTALQKNIYNFIGYFNKYNLKAFLQNMFYSKLIKENKIN